MRTLYISDLDGTLLTPGGEISPGSLTIINNLLDEGMNLTFATARTASTALAILRDVKVRLPLIFMNGVAIYDAKQEAYIRDFELTEKQVTEALYLLTDLGQPAFIYSISDNCLSCYAPPELNHSMARFKSHREERYGKVFTPIDSYLDLLGRKVIYINFVGSNEALMPAYRAFSQIEGLECLFYEDVYEDDWFLEIHRKGVSKGTAALAVKEEINADRLVVFGDNLNDMPMFYVADYRYAMANGHEQIRQASDQILGPNTQNSVAEELLRLWHEQVGRPISVQGGLYERL